MWDRSCPRRRHPNRGTGASRYPSLPVRVEWCVVQVLPTIGGTLKGGRVPPGLLAGHEESFLQYLKGSHSVLTFQDSTKGKWHNNGRKENVMPCFTAIQKLIAKWRRRQAVNVMCILSRGECYCLIYLSSISTYT